MEGGGLKFSIRAGRAGNQIVRACFASVAIFSACATNLAPDQTDWIFTRFRKRWPEILPPGGGGPVESLRAILPFRKSFERAQQPWNTGSAVSINRLMKWLGRKKENRWKKERERRRRRKGHKSGGSQSVASKPFNVSALIQGSGQLASSELTSFEFPNGPNTRRERERKGNEKNVSMLVYACRMERDAGWGKRKSSARYFNEGSLEHRGRSFILRVRQLFWCWKLRNCWFRRSMREGEGGARKGWRWKK